MPGWALYAGILVFGVGLVTTAVLLVPAKTQPMTLAERVTAYTVSTGTTKAEAKSATEPMFDQAKAAAAGVLERNKGLEEEAGRSTGDSRKRVQALRVAAAPRRAS